MHFVDQCGNNVYKILKYKCHLYKILLIIKKCTISSPYCSESLQSAMLEHARDLMAELVH